MGDASATDDAPKDDIARTEWVCCDECNRWRRVLQSEVPADETAKWYCSMSSDPLFNSCDAPEEAWDVAEWQTRGGWVEREPCGDLIAPSCWVWARRRRS